MPATSYQFSKAADFAAGISPDQLQRAIVNSGGAISSAACTHINGSGDAIFIWFDGELSAPDVTALNAIVAAHIPIPIISSASATCDAVVSNAPNRDAGDFESVAAAFAAGRKSVFVQNGVYIETADIVIPDFGQLVGETPGGVYIVLAAGAKVVCDAVTAGGGGSASAGTVSIPNASSTVTGVATTFTSLTPGQFILLGSNYFPIASIASDTSLTIADIYHGAAITAQPMKAHSIFSGVRIENFILYGSAAEAMLIRGVRNSAFSTIAIYTCGAGVIFRDSADLSVISIVINHCAGVGMELDSCYSVSLNIINNYNNGGDGFRLTGDTFNINIQTSTSESNGGNGFVFSDTVSRMNVTDAVVKQNVGHGFVVGANVECVSLSSVESSGNGGSGVVVSGKHTYVGEGFLLDNAGDGARVEASAVAAVVESNMIANNAGAGIAIYGANTTATANQVSNNASTTAGIVVSAARAIVSTNNSRNNAQRGIVLTATASACVVTSNSVSGNAGGSIQLAEGSANCAVSLNVADAAVSQPNDLLGSVVVNNVVVA
jgi:hypothetical protein